jgi:ketosteroid isomerase-like protein
MYDAFAASDLPRFLKGLSDDVEWQYGGHAPVPWLAPCQGRAAVIEAFKNNAKHVEFKITPKTFLESGDLAVVVVDAELRVKSNGQLIIEEDAAHIWRFNAEGLVTRYRSRADTAAHERAFLQRP